MRDLLCVAFTSGFVYAGNMGGIDVFLSFLRDFIFKKVVIEDSLSLISLSEFSKQKAFIQL